MKIIGEAGNGTFICQITKDEIEKALNLYYNKMPTAIKVGQEINLGAGYDYRSAIQSACQSMTDSMADFERARKTLSNFASMVSTLHQDDKEGGAA